MAANKKNMIRDYVIETLKKIKEINEKVHTLYDLGVDIIELETGISQLERSISVALRKKEDKKFAYIQDLVGWWLYEDVEKTIWYGNEDQEKVDPANVEGVDLTDIEKFVDFLIEEYGNKNSSL
jgi:hypothetical protein